MVQVLVRLLLQDFSWRNWLNIFTIIFFVSPLVKKGFTIVKPHLRTAAKNIVSDVLSHQARKHPSGDRITKPKKDKWAWIKNKSCNDFLKGRTLFRGEVIYFKTCLESAERTMTQLDLFTAPMTQLSIKQTQYVEVQPVTANTERGSIKFFILRDGENYTVVNGTPTFAFEIKNHKRWWVEHSSECMCRCN